VKKACGASGSWAWNPERARVPPERLGEAEAMFAEERVAEE
jgi:hypothetical protein